jgi:hypothetical protein
MDSWFGFDLPQRLAWCNARDSREPRLARGPERSCSEAAMCINKDRSFERFVEGRGGKKFSATADLGADGTGAASRGRSPYSHTIG